MGNIVSATVGISGLQAGEDVNDTRRPAAEVPGQGTRGGTTGMSENRLPDYLDHIQQAAADARSFVEGMEP